MRSRMFLLLSVLVVGILGTALPAPAYYVSNTYNLERTEIRGYVEAVEDQVAYILTDDGTEVAVQLGPESYWRRHGYYLPEGEYVEMEVWYDPTDQYTDWYFAGAIQAPGLDIVLTNDEGVPFWVIFRNDYYYSLGYRASCISYMVWFDCPPVYFTYLMLPPPPPRTYICFYGPRWRHHYTDWGYGERYCSGGSYWQDGHGYQRPGRRGHPEDRPRWNDGPDAGKRNLSYSDASPRPATPAAPPAVKLQPRTDLLRNRPAPQPASYDRRVTAPATPPAVRTQPRMDSRQNRPDTRQPRYVQRPMAPPSESRYQRPASEPRVERRGYAPPTEPQKAQVQPRRSESVKRDGQAPRAVSYRETPRPQSSPQVRQQNGQQYPPPQSHRQQGPATVHKNKDATKDRR